jgi:hypothetical protein
MQRFNSPTLVLTTTVLSNVLACLRPSSPVACCDVLDCPSLLLSQVSLILARSFSPYLHSRFFRRPLSL